MAEYDAVADHYSHGQLLDAILIGMRNIGKTPETITVDDLAAVDEFHIGGRQATEDFIGQLGISPDDHVLDVGCGLAGTSRFVASTCGCRVSGIDLTPEYIDAGKALCSWVIDRNPRRLPTRQTLVFRIAVFSVGGCRYRAAVDRAIPLSPGSPASTPL